MTFLMKSGVVWPRSEERHGEGSGPTAACKTLSQSVRSVPAGWRPSEGPAPLPHPFTSFGPSDLTGARRVLYWGAYGLLATGAFLLGLLIMAVHLG